MAEGGGFPSKLSDLEVTDTFTDPSGTSHTGELADSTDTASKHSDLTGVEDRQHQSGPAWTGLGASSPDKTDGSSATASIFWDHAELRCPGEASASDEARVYDSFNTLYDPSESWTVRINVSNVTIVNDSSAIMVLSIADSGDTSSGSPGDRLTAQVRGNGRVDATCSNDGTANNVNDTTQDNTWASALNFIECDWDGSTLTVKASDGSTTVTVTNSTNYPSGENLTFKAAARDGDTANSRNVDFDIDSMDVTSP